MESNEEVKVLQEIENKIADLFAEREKILRDMEIHEGPFVVFDKGKMRIDDNTIVLTPAVRKDIPIIQSYIRTLGGSLEERFSQWLSSYTDYRCRSTVRTVCPIKQIPVCCAHCEDAAECMLLEDTPCCGLVSLGEILDVKECNEI